MNLTKGSRTDRTSLVSTVTGGHLGNGMMIPYTPHDRSAAYSLHLLQRIQNFNSTCKRASQLDVHVRCDVLPIFITHPRIATKPLQLVPQGYALDRIYPRQRLLTQLVALTGWRSTQPLDVSGTLPTLPGVLYRSSGSARAAFQRGRHGRSSCDYIVQRAIY